MSMAYLMLYCEPDTEDGDVTVRLGLHGTDFFVSTLNGEAQAALKVYCNTLGKPIPYGDIEVSFDLVTLDRGAVGPGTLFHLSHEGVSFFSDVVVRRDAKFYP